MLLEEKFCPDVGSFCCRKGERRSIKKRAVQAKIVVLGPEENGDLVADLLENGANGYITTQSRLAELRRAGSLGP